MYLRRRQTNNTTRRIVPARQAEVRVRRADFSNNAPMAAMRAARQICIRALSAGTLVAVGTGAEYRLQVPAVPRSPAHSNPPPDSAYPVWSRSKSLLEGVKHAEAG
jgi:hypothetical protein